MLKQVSAFMAVIPLFLTVDLMSGEAAAQGFESPQDVVFTSKLDGTEQRYVVVLPEGFRADHPASAACPPQPPVPSRKSVRGNQGRQKSYFAQPPRFLLQDIRAVSLSQTATDPIHVRAAQ